ncbi:iron-containing alcohol dehydrogenase [Candidatus Izemoplasma sp. B36]|uniref:iron-containing alcohol dehydrogenase n=1 Tax=Candidatus Izemoplasma sp. B36 TaxID=3242468 RepID=UPI0035562653
MMRPMKLAGSELLFGKGSLEYLEKLNAKKAVLVLAGDFLYSTGIMDIVHKHLDNAGIAYVPYVGIEPDPYFSTVIKGAEFMLEHNPDIIIAIGGGSAMDAAKAMWIYYEHPEIESLDYITVKENFPKLRNKARFCCIPTTAGTASEVSRSIVITDDETHIKYGIGNMEMMPDIAICDPVTTLSLPNHITAETGMDALCHALEALASTRANYLSDILAEASALDIFNYLPKVINDPKNIDYREKMINAAMVAGLAFTNVSLGITHSIAHGLGSLFNMPHGLANAILLPYIVAFNSLNIDAKAIYDNFASKLNEADLSKALFALNEKVNIPSKLSERITDEEKFLSKLDTLIEFAIKDGCTKTNPILPTKTNLKNIILAAYYGKEVPKQL